MPKPRASKEAAAAPRTSDPRFSNFTTDPRFRLPSKKQTRTKIDKRFSRMLTDNDFSNTAKVDRYGRKLSSSAPGKKKALERLYMKEEEDDDDDGEDEEENGDEEAQEGQDENIEVEDDEVVEKELKRAERGYDPARGGGFSSSEEDSDDDDSDGGVEIEEEVGEGGEMRIQDTGIEMGEVSSRIAVVNMDWDNIRAIDLMAVFSSFAEPGKIHKISVYPSEFGRERMEREEMEGPPKEIFSKKDDASDEDSDDDSEDEDEDEKIKKDLLKEDDGKDFDGAALRQYQLERLRYYYAVIVCSDEKTAKNIYDNTDGSEYLGSANVFDLRFIPDGTEFDEKARDECDKVPTDYRPTEFVTAALQHSKVKLTWDQNPEDAVRKDALNRAFSGSRAEIGENDLRAYLGSDSESDAEEEEAEAEPTDEPKLTKKELARQKMRAALGLSDEPTSKPKKGGPVGDMEVTFTAGLTAKEKGSIFENEPIKEETTAERYIRKERERKARRKEKAKAVREGRDPEAEPENEEAETADADLGFDDPFFAEDKDVKDKAAKNLRKAERQKKREAKQKEAEEKALNRAELELLMADNTAETAAHLDHFDMNEIARTEKQKRKKQRSKKSSKEGEPESKRGGLQENFEIDVGDERFGKVFEDHEFAIDPSNPRFKGTEGMKKLLEEGRRKRGIDKMEDAAVERPMKKKRDDGTGDVSKDDLSNLVEKIKKKSKRV